MWEMGERWTCAMMKTMVEWKACIRKKEDITEAPLGKASILEQMLR